MDQSEDERERNRCLPFHKFFFLVEPQFCVLALLKVGGGNDMSIVVEDNMKLDLSVIRTHQSN